MILMNCPACGAEGRLPNDRVNTALTCKRCLKTFHVKPSGRAVLGEPQPDGTTSTQPEGDSRGVDHSADIDRWLARLTAAARNFGRYAAALAVVLLGYGLYQAVLRPMGAEEQALRTAMAIARNDHSTIRNVALSGTGDAAVGWFDSMYPEFKQHIQSSYSLVPRAEIVSIERDPATSSAKVVTRLTLVEQEGRNRITASDAPPLLRTPSLEVPLVLVDGGWGRWQLDIQQTIAMAAREGQQKKEAVSLDR